jgi:carbon-monoxide dehydrogenase medium subunit/xanthine dehydrogenase FAD-binding subunit
MLTCDSYAMPQSLAEALRAYAEAPEGSRYVAGATDTLPWAREGRAGDVHLPTLIDLTKVAELNGYTVGDGRVRLGANTVIQRFLTDPELRRTLPCMPYCAVWFADDQIREQATLAGNLVNASPAADATPPMLAMNAEVEVAGLGDGAVTKRTVALGDLVTGPGRTSLKPGEIVTAVTCDDMTGYGGAFEKVGPRRSLVLSTVCAACLVKVSEDAGTFADVRLAMAGIGPVPVRLSDVENSLRGKPVGARSIAEASRRSTVPIASRTRRQYRREVVIGFIARAIENALSDGGIELAPETPREKTRV